MYLIVLGAGPVGAALAQEALEHGHDVVLIEADEERAARMAERFDARVLHARIADGGILDEAGAADADAFVATTDDDAANLMAMVLARDAPVATLVSIVNDAQHRRLFERLGVHVLIDPEAIVSHYLYGLLQRPDVEDAVVLPCGGLAFELELTPDAPLVGATRASAAEDGPLAGKAEIVWIRRSEDVGVRAEADARFAVGDRLTVFAREPLGQEELRAFGSRS
ncbi:MAG: TrkA family potassium uptake protein [Myxococcales bacterium]|nr:TrkA family potassium uptake protein [Myxococcales bacterium]